MPGSSTFKQSLLTILLCLLQFQWGYVYAHANTYYPQASNTATTTTTNSTVRFEINLTWEDWVVAGKTRKTILTNGQFPAPALRLKQGDNVEFLVNNSMPFSTTVHFHGILLLFSTYLFIIIDYTDIILESRHRTNKHPLVRRRPRPIPNPHPTRQSIPV